MHQALQQARGEVKISSSNYSIGTPPSNYYKAPIEYTDDTGVMNEVSNSIREPTFAYRNSLKASTKLEQIVEREQGQEID